MRANRLCIRIPGRIRPMDQEHSAYLSSSFTFGQLAATRFQLQPFNNSIQEQVEKKVQTPVELRMVDLIWSEAPSFDALSFE